MTVEWNNYIFTIERDDFEENSLHIRVQDPAMEHEYPVFHLKLKDLWTREGEGFGEGDYYQDVMNKEMMVPSDKKISYAAIVHDFLQTHSTQFSYIKKIYSSSLNGHELESWTPSLSTRNFWAKQHNKNIGVQLINDRYMIPINE